ncbi:MAG: hypothetical protein FD133_807 [Erysipelotrichaceae bacterium]|nr:MAG: hypothetical protein FD133_807 [Erysipelotrichaceae bacterium]
MNELLFLDEYAFFGTEEHIKNFSSLLTIYHPIEYTERSLRESIDPFFLAAEYLTSYVLLESDLDSLRSNPLSLDDLILKLFPGSSKEIKAFLVASRQLLDMDYHLVLEDFDEEDRHLAKYAMDIALVDYDKVMETLPCCLDVIYKAEDIGLMLDFTKTRSLDIER